MEGIAFGEQPRWHEGRLWFRTGGRRRSSPSMWRATVGYHDIYQ